MALSYNLGYQESISVHPTRRQNFAGNSRSTGISQLRAGKTGQKFVVPTFHIHFLNPECVRIPWVLAPKKIFPLKIFGYRAIYKKFPFFTNFHVALVKKNCRPAADSILMPPTFHIARLNRYTPNFSGVGQKLTWCQQFGLQIFPK